MNGHMNSPIDEIIAERKQARELGDANVDVCFLSTITAAGHPTVRAISLRDIDERGFELLLNSETPKWDQLHEGKGFEMLMFWHSVVRQYRIRGSMEPLEREKTLVYWERKSLGSRLLELYYPTFERQTTAVPSRQHLLQNMEALKQKHPSADSVPLPDELRGVRVVPEHIEAWHGGSERLHDRRLYTRSGEGWSVQVLVP